MWWNSSSVTGSDGPRYCNRNLGSSESGKSELRRKHTLEQQGLMNDTLLWPQCDFGAANLSVCQSKTFQ